MNSQKNGESVLLEENYKKHVFGFSLEAIHLGFKLIVILNPGCVELS